MIGKINAPAESQQGQGVPRDAGRREGMIVVFATMEELRIWGPVGLQEWLKRNRPPGRRLLRTGQVVEFEPAHQTAGSRDSGGES